MVVSVCGVCIVWYMYAQGKYWKETKMNCDRPLVGDYDYFFLKPFLLFRFKKKSFYLRKILSTYKKQTE